MSWAMMCSNRGHHRKNTQRRDNVERELEQEWSEVKGVTIRRFATQGYIPEIKEVW